MRLTDQIELLSFQEKLAEHKTAGPIFRWLRKKWQEPATPPPSKTDMTGDKESPPDTYSGAAGEPNPPF